jgi:predicted metalloprotease
VSEYEQISATTGDAAWINVMAHAWSHHLQYLLGRNTVARQTTDNVGLELEATCMGGSYVGSVRAQGRVDDALIPTMVGMFVGDAAHGTTAQVQAAFLNGVESGSEGCGLGL